MFLLLALACATPAPPLTDAVEVPGLELQVPDGPRSVETELPGAVRVEVEGGGTVVLTGTEQPHSLDVLALYLTRKGLVPQSETVDAVGQTLTIQHAQTTSASAWQCPETGASYTLLVELPGNPRRGLQLHRSLLASVRCTEVEWPQVGFVEWGAPGFEVSDGEGERTWTGEGVEVHSTRGSRSILGIEQALPYLAGGSDAVGGWLTWEGEPRTVAGPDGPREVQQGTRVDSAGIETAVVAAVLRCPDERGYLVTASSKSEGHEALIRRLAEARCPGRSVAPTPPAATR